MAVYWAIMISALLSVLFERKLCRTVKVNGGIEYRPGWRFIIASVFLLTLFAALRTQPGDTGAYIDSFNNTPSDLSEFTRFVSSTDDQLFYGIQFFFHLITKDATLWLSFLALIHTVCLVIGLKAFSPDFSMSLFLFVGSALAFNWMFNGIRQFVAVSILFASTGLILKKKYVPYFLIVLAVGGITPILNLVGLDNPIWFLGGIHQSAILMIPIVLMTAGDGWSKRFWLTFPILLLLVAALGGSDSLFDAAVSSSSYAGDLQYIKSDSGSSPIRALIAFVPVLLVFLKHRQIFTKQTPRIIHLAANMSVVTFFIYVISSFTSGIYIGRIPIYSEMYNLILIPWLVKHPYKNEQKVLYLGIFGGYLLNFIYQMEIAWDGLPYCSDVLRISLW